MCDHLYNDVGLFDHLNKSLGCIGFYVIDKIHFLLGFSLSEIKD